jgi:predicted nucleotidyltransferase
MSKTLMQIVKQKLLDSVEVLVFGSVVEGSFTPQSDI